MQLPPAAGIPDLVRDLRQFATDSGVTLDSLTPSTPAVLGATDGAAAVAAAGPGSVVGIPLQLSVTGDYFEASLYVKQLQTKLQRSMLISAISVTPSQATESTATTAAATSSTAATATATATAEATTVTTAPINLEYVTLTITSSLFVLMDGTTRGSLARARGTSGTTEQERI